VFTAWLVAAMLAVPGTAAAADVTGVWRPPAGGAEIEISPCGDSMCGRLIDSDDLRKNPDARDTDNHNLALRSRPVKGLLMMYGFHRADEAWVGGTIYDPSDGMSYRMSMKLLAPDKLQIRGCLVGPLCRAQSWRRVK